MRLLYLFPIIIIYSLSSHIIHSLIRFLCHLSYSIPYPISYPYYTLYSLFLYFPLCSPHILLVFHTHPIPVHLHSLTIYFIFISTLILLYSRRLYQYNHTCISLLLHLCVSIVLHLRRPLH